MLGLRINNYEIVGSLGNGGMGTVYRARHPFMGREAAIKIMRREFVEDGSLVARFMNEARAANAIRHPNIIDIIDVGTLPDGGRPYLMMELLEGENLGARIKRGGPLPVVEAVEIACQTASALAAAHAQGIVHRDLKPDNLFLVQDPHAPAGVRVKVLDFGVAKLRPELRGELSSTRSGAFMGTPRYASPEQCSGAVADLDQRTDVYSLGLILYCELAGEPPFMSEGFGDVIMQHMSAEPPPLRPRRPDLPQALVGSIRRALAKRPEDRFQSMEELEAALRSSIAELVPAPAGASDQRPSGTFLPYAGSVATVRVRGGRRRAVGWVVLGAAAAIAALFVQRELRPRAPQAVRGADREPTTAAARPATPSPPPAPPQLAQPQPQPQPRAVTTSPAPAPPPPSDQDPTPVASSAPGGQAKPGTAPPTTGRAASKRAHGRRRAEAESAVVVTEPRPARPAPAAPAGPPPKPGRNAEKW